MTTETVLAIVKAAADLAVAIYDHFKKNPPNGAADAAIQALMIEELQRMNRSVSSVLDAFVPPKHPTVPPLNLDIEWIK